MSDKNKQALMPVAEAEYPVLEVATDVVAELCHKHARLLIPQEDPGAAPENNCKGGQRSPSKDRARRFIVWVMPLASLFGTGYLLWRASLAPHLDRLPLPALLAEAAEYALLAWAAYAAFQLGFCLLVPQTRNPEAIPFTVRSSTAAIWFAPAMVLVSALSVGAIAAWLILVSAATRLLYFHWRQIYSEESPEEQSLPSLEIFSAPSPSPSFHRLVPSLTVSFAIQVGLLATFMGRALTAGVMFAIAAGALTLFATTAGVWRPHGSSTLPRSVLDVTVTVILAGALTVAGLHRNLELHPETRWDNLSEPRPGLFQSAQRLLGSVLYDHEERVQSPEEVAIPIFNPPAQSAEIDSDSFPGVVLQPEVKPQTLLVDPMPALAGGLPRTTSVNPLSIPFAGEYWMYQAPQARPPAKSLTRRGSPLAIYYYTTDHRPMFMEARHRFDHAIDLRCCGKIRVSISNADSYLGTNSLGLFLANTKSKGQALSLGWAEVKSRSAVTIWNRNAPPVPETLEFTVPSSSSLREFNEIRIVFRRDRMRIDRSARIAIERFTFVPPGM